MAESFPLSLKQLISILQILAPTNKVGTGLTQSCARSAVCHYPWLLSNGRCIRKCSARSIIHLLKYFTVLKLAFREYEAIILAPLPLTQQHTCIAQPRRRNLLIVWFVSAAAIPKD
jgi:hypothetical protein